MTVTELMNQAYKLDPDTQLTVLTRTGSIAGVESIIVTNNGQFLIKPFGIAISETMQEELFEQKAIDVLMESGLTNPKMKLS